MISYIIPTHNRPDELRRTLHAIGGLPPHAAEIIVVDNASNVPPRVPMLLENGVHVNLIFRSANEGAAARNHGVLASDPRSDWIVMLDDDSHPVDAEFIGALADQPRDVAAVGAEIMLGGSHAAPDVDTSSTKFSYVPPTAALSGRCVEATGTARHRPCKATVGGTSDSWNPYQSPRESGGLPEVFIGCGVAIRRGAFLDAGGYDPSFNYYAEEYDLAAKLLLAGRRIVLDRRFRVVHRKVGAGRDMNLILRRLVRNNGWVMQRYAPDHLRKAEIRHVVTRYGSIASKEHALVGYTAGFAELLSTLRLQPRREMSQAIFDRFTGLAEARESLQEAWSQRVFQTARVIHEGKNAEVIVRAIEELGVRVLRNDTKNEADVQVIGTLSPGPLLDAWEREVASNQASRIVSPWRSLAGDQQWIGRLARMHAG